MVVVDEIGPPPISSVAPASDGWFDPALPMAFPRALDPTDVSASDPLHDVFETIAPEAGVFGVEQEG